ncbi:MAG: TrmH family RNA methyltransferase [Flavobacteriaceae bacterium]
MAKQHDHYTHQIKKQNFPITVVLGALRTPQNIGMCLRVCEAFGVSKVYYDENGPDLNNRLLKRTAREAEKKLSVISYNDVISLLENHEQNDFKILALELTDKSVNIRSYAFNPQEKICLIVGSERYGIPQDVLNKCQDYIAIDMYGENSSINVATSLSIALYEITNQIRTQNS